MDSNFSSNLFNSSIIASIIAGVEEIGLFDEINKANSIAFESFCQRKKIQQYPFEVILQALASYKIITFENYTISKNENFENILANKGYFTWLVKGYSHSLENIDGLLKSEKLNTSIIKRNGYFIAKAGKDYGANYVDNYFYELINEIKPKHILDIGCGSADRLINLINFHSVEQAIGIDVNLAATELAKENIIRANLENKIHIVCGDIGKLKFEKRFENIDLIFSFFMGHDLFPKENCFKVFSNFKSLFPNAERFLLCDTYKSEKREYPIFTLGFELTHALMGQILPTYSDWLELFSELKWDVINSRQIGIANSSIFNIKL